MADGSNVSQVNSQIEAGNRVKLVSGGDTTLNGAVVRGRQVTGDIGGNLVIAGRQDTSVFAGKLQSASAGITIPIGVGTGGGNLNASKSNTTSTFASVAEQSGIQAGDAGFNVNVAGNTTLTGGAITSTQKAIDDGVNRFATGGTLTTSDIQNQASYSGTSVGVNLGTGADSSGKLTLGGSSAGFGRDSGNASSVTAAAISGIAGNKAARTGDTGTGIQKIFDAEKVQKDINAQAQITQAFGREASTAIGDYAASQQKQAFGLREQASRESDPDRVQALQQQAQALDDNWGANGTLRLLAHTLVGGLTGGASGAAGTVAGTLTAPLVAAQLQQVGIDGALAKTLTALASTAAGAAAGGVAGAGTALNEVANNYLKHDEIVLLLKAQFQCSRSAPGSAACGEVKRLEALDKQRDQDLIAACQNTASAACQNQQKEVRAAYADIIRKSQQEFGVLTPKPLDYNTNREHTEAIADSTLSLGGRTLGAVEGFGNSGIVEPVKALAQGFLTMLQAATGGSEAQSKVGAFVNNLSALTKTDTLVAVLTIATQAQREDLALAYERGDAQGVGRVAGNILANMPVGLGPIGSIRKIDAVVDAGKLAEGAANGAVNVAKGIKLQEGANSFNRMRLGDIRFTQDTVSPNFSDGGTISDAVAGLRNGRIKPDDFPAIRIVEKDGVTYSLDNRRLATFSAAEVEDIPVQRLSLSDPDVLAEFLKKFKPIEGGQKIVVVPKAERADSRRILNQFGKYD